MWGYMISAFVIGVVLGMAAMVVVAEEGSKRAAVRRHRKRALLGLPDRPPARSDAHGTARIHRADIANSKEWGEQD